MTPPPNGFRTFVIVWATQSISVLGTALTLFAINIWLAQTRYPLPAQKAELAFALSGVAVASSVTLFLSPIAGAWADRHDRRLTMAAMDIASGALGLFLAYLLATGRLQLPVLIAGAFVYAALGMFHQLAFDASYATLVPAEQLPRANGMMQTMFGLSGIIAPALAAFLIGLPALVRITGLPWIGPALAAMRSGVPLAVAVDAATFFLSAASLLLVAIPSPRRTDLHRRSLWQDAGFGAVYIWLRRPLLWLLGTFTVANFVGTFGQVFLPLIVKFNLQPDWTARGFHFDTALALLTSVGSLGGVAGGLAISAWGGLRRRRILGVLIPMIVAAASQVVFGLSAALYLSAAMLAIAFGMSPFLNAHSQAIWQTQVPQEMQGRVFSVRRLIAQFTVPISSALAGWAGAAFNPGDVIAVLGVLYGVFCAAQLFNPYLRRVEDREWLEGLAAGRPAR